MNNKLKNENGNVIIEFLVVLPLFFLMFTLILSFLFHLLMVQQQQYLKQELINLEKVSEPNEKQIQEIEIVQKKLQHIENISLEKKINKYLHQSSFISSFLIIFSFLFTILLTIFKKYFPNIWQKLLLKNKILCSFNSNKVEEKSINIDCEKPAFLTFPRLDDEKLNDFIFQIETKLNTLQNHLNLFSIEDIHILTSNIPTDLYNVIRTYHELDNKNKLIFKNKIEETFEVILGKISVFEQKLVNKNIESFEKFQTLIFFRYKK